MAKKKDNSNKQIEVNKFTKEDFALDDLDRKIIKFFIDYPKATKDDAAIALDVSRNLIWKRQRKPAMMRAMAELTRDFLDVLKDTQSASVRRLKQLVNDPDKEIALKAIKMAMAPYVNSGFLSVTSKVDEVITHSVKFGEAGLIIKETNTVEADNKKDQPASTIAGTALGDSASDNDGVIDAEFN